MINKKRVINFDCIFTIESLEELPIKAYDVSVVWIFKDTQSLFKNKLSGKTLGKSIVDNRVVWNQNFKISISIPLNSKTNEIEHQYITFQIMSKKTAQTSVEELGKVIIDLIDFARGGKITKSYLMRDSLLNSTLKASIELVQTSGDRLWKSPKSLDKSVKEELTETESQDAKRKFTMNSEPTYVPQGATLQINPHDVVDKVILNSNKSEKPKPSTEDAKLTSIIDDILNMKKNE
jgi:hypothetical protein